MKLRILCLLLCVAILLPLAAACQSNTPQDEKGSQTVADSRNETEERSETETKSEDEISAETDPSVETDPVAVPNTAKILTKSLYLFVGQTYMLEYEPDDRTREVEWDISTDCVEIVNGVVSAKKEGAAVISAGQDTQCSVKVLSRTMPEIYVFADGVKITSEENYVPCRVSVTTENEDYTFLSEPAGIRLRGNSTASAPKKPYRIKFDSKVNILGMNDGAECKSWVLLAEWYDTSLIRNSTALSLGNALLDEYCSDWRYVRLILDGVDKGVYVLAEQSQINKYRVDIEEAGADTSALRSGYFYEIEGSKVDNGKFFVSYEDLEIYTFLGDKYTIQSTDIQTDGKRRSGIFLELKNEGVSEAQREFANKYAQNIFTLIYAATYEDTYYEMDSSLNLVERKGMTAEEAISLAVDVDSMARMYILWELVCNYDAFKKSSYFYVDFSEGGTGKLTFTCPWDHDRSFTKEWNSLEFEEYDEYYTAQKNVFYVMMMNHEWFREKVAEVWEEVTTESDYFKNTREMMRSIGLIYETDFEEELALWNRSFAKDWEYDSQDWANEMQGWLGMRIAWLDEQFKAMKASD